MGHPIPPSEPAETPKLPELNQATLDWPGVEALLRDIQLCTEITEIIPKQAAQAYVPQTGTLTIEDAREILLNRAARGLQIRYHYEGADWWDTIMILPDCYRLVRIKHEFGGTPSLSL